MPTSRGAPDHERRLQALAPAPTATAGNNAGHGRCANHQRNVDYGPGAAHRCCTSPEHCAGHERQARSAANSADLCLPRALRLTSADCPRRPPTPTTNADHQRFADRERSADHGRPARAPPSTSAAPTTAPTSNAAPTASANPRAPIQAPLSPVPGADPECRTWMPSPDAVPERRPECRSRVPLTSAVRRPRAPLASADHDGRHSTTTS